MQNNKVGGGGGGMNEMHYIYPYTNLLKDVAKMLTS